MDLLRQQQHIHQATPPVEWSQVMDVLDCLGKDPAETFLRAIKPPRGPAHKFRLDPSKVEGYVHDGFGLYFNVGNGGTCKPEISSVPAFWAEWDDRPKSAQITLWRGLGLPPPSLQIDTAGKSIHTYWVLAEPIRPDRWSPIQERLLVLLADMSAITLLFYGPPQLIVDAFSNGKSTTGQTELIIQNYTDSLIRDRSLVVVGSA